MKRLQRIAFNVLAALSLLACAALVVVWVRSFRGDARLVSFTTSGGARYTLKSSFGRWVLLAPPGGKAGDDAQARAIAARMSNDDLVWNPPARRGYIEGTVRLGTATAEMFELVRDRLKDPADLSPVERVWLAALDDPRRFLPAHLMLLLRGRGVWFQRVEAGDWPVMTAERWFDANAENGSPVFYVRANAAGDSGTAPDLTRQPILRDEWHDLFDEPRLVLFQGWPVLVAMVLPLIWAARPRRRAATNRRWLFNAAALASLLLCLALAGMWTRSCWVDEQWVFAPRPAPMPSALKMMVREPWQRQRWVGSSKGQFILLEREAPKSSTRSAPPVGYGRAATPAYRQPINVAGQMVQDQRQLVIPGVRFFAAPSQVLPPSKAPPAPLYPGGPPVSIGWGTLFGYRSLILAWWVPLLAAGILPALWLVGDVRRRLRLRRESRRHLCRACGYDLRATPDRCPECGTIPTSRPPHPLAPMLTT